MQVQNRVMTTGQVAKVFSVNINTVIKWFDEGKLAGFRLPRSNERRIYRESVLTFMRDHGIADELLRIFEDTQKVKRRGRKPGGALAIPANGHHAEGGPEQRIFPRKPVELHAHLEGGGLDGQEAPVTVRNLSLGGAYLTDFNPTRRLIPEEFNLIVEGTDGSPRLETSCEVVHVRRTASQGLTLGCRFTRVDPRTLQSFLAGI